MEHAISIVVPCRNEIDQIENSIKSILSQTDIRYPFEIIVADGMSDDGTREVLTRLSALDQRLKLIDNPKKIVSAGLNLAINQSTGDIIIRMDTHTEYANDYVSNCVSELLRTKADNVGGAALTKYSTFIQKANCLAFHSPFAVGGARFHNVNYEGYVDTVTYGCWLKSTLLDIGMFDEEFVRNQDDELNLRIIRNGGSIWQSSRIKSWYFPRSRLVDIFKQYSQYGYWKVLVIKKHKIPASFRHVVPSIFVASLIASSFLSIFFDPAFNYLCIVLSAYAIACVLSVIHAIAITKEYKCALVLPIIFMAYHFGYGLGFLHGIYNFIVLDNASSKIYEGITR